MNDILNRLTVLLALGAFLTVAAVSMGAGVEPMVSLFRATVALVFFGFFGRIGLGIVLRGILEELAKHRKEAEQIKNSKDGPDPTVLPAGTESVTKEGATETE